MLARYHLFFLISTIILFNSLILLYCKNNKLTEEKWIIFKSRNSSSLLLIISSLNITQSFPPFKSLSSFVSLMKSCNVFYNEKIENFSPDFRNNSTLIELDELLLKQLMQYCILNYPSSSKLIYRWPEFLKSLIYPGTKWCGLGNNSSSYDDLGKQRYTDFCCRDHDHCPQYINGHQEKYGLYNNSSYTRSHCECDKKFYDCLKNNSDHTSKIIGRTYFNLLNTKCFEFNYPIQRCEILTSIPFGKKCTKYILDKLSKKRYQFFDTYLF